jgi:hypothetical protein
MKQEIDAALDLLVSYISHFGSVKEESIEEFRTHLGKNLLERYQGHWYPGKLDRQPALCRCIRGLSFL